MAKIGTNASEIEKEEKVEKNLKKNWRQKVEEKLGKVEKKVLKNLRKSFKNIARGTQSWYLSKSLRDRSFGNKNFTQKCVNRKLQD